ncbi:enoyl-CoA hydratase/isomerase family protein [Roseovarius salinarum]|uniref:enoyl-CoA hydratase/isomerase family protein n=1 Tax=Roseovarius salinarum TaxID=1981892 RepID=UPI000C34492A|nr:enoyl-CoA hydratase/isomerase family protein [Roseovarius salinarum]
MSDIDIRTDGRAGRITLTRPKALNALSYRMCLAVEDAIDAWAHDDAVDLVILDAEGEKAFCAGGDIAELYETGTRGDFAYGQRFWRDEYRMNAKMHEYPKPVVSFLQGFTMGGGVGLGCHGSHRVVCDTSRIAMPECSIGLVPDVGGSWILARAPGHLGEYLGTTGTRMGPADAIRVGFADHYLPDACWAEVKAELARTGRTDAVTQAAQTPAQGKLEALEPHVAAHFAGDTLGDIVASLRADDSDFAQETLAAMARNSPLSMACAIEMQHRLRDMDAGIREALGLEYRFTHRAMEHGDLLEGIRAAIIDKDRNPRWQHTLDAPPMAAAARMLEPLGERALTFERED